MLRREDVVDAAVHLLEEVGLDALTTRALTDRLGVQRGALYWHVKSKKDLLAAVAERIIEPVFVNLDGHLEWAEKLAVFATRLRVAMLAHRDGDRLVAFYSTLGCQSVESTIVDVLRGDDIPRCMAFRYQNMIAGYVIGFTLGRGVWQSCRDESGAGPGCGTRQDEAFEAGVATIILGMQTEVGLKPNASGDLCSP